MDKEVLVKLSKDMLAAAKLLTPEEVKHVVMNYYMQQDNRIRADHQILQLKKKYEDIPKDKRPSHLVLDWISENTGALESQIRSVLSHYSKNQAIGRWAEANWGIGPVISAGLIAFINMDKSPTVGHIYRYSGNDPTVIWCTQADCLSWIKENGGASEDLIIKSAAHFGRFVDSLRRFATTNREGKPVKLTNDTLAAALARRPWNADFKTLCWKIGESFVKISGKIDEVTGQPASVYGRLYNERRIQEDERSKKLLFKDQAAAVLARTPNHAQRKTYKEGELPDGHLFSRAKRYAVKIFLSHWWEQNYWFTFGKAPPAPFAIGKLSHAHYIEPEVPIIKRKDDGPSPAGVTVPATPTAPTQSGVAAAA